MPRFLISITVVILMTSAACSNGEPPESQEPEQTAVEAPAADDHHLPPTTEDEVVEETAEETASVPSEPEQQSSQEAQPTQSVDRDLDEVRQQIETLVNTGQFTQARMLAQEQAAANSGAARDALDAQLASLRRLEQQGHQASAAMELLGGNNVEQRRGRRLLLDGGKAGRILLQQAVREAESDLADEAVTLLVVLDETSAFPALLQRYMDSVDDPEQKALRNKLHESMVAMAPQLDQQHLAELPDIISRDADQRFPALVEVLTSASTNPEHEQQFAATTTSLLRPYVERAYEFGDPGLRAWALSVSDAVGLSLFQARINFQTKDAPTPDGYIADYGLVEHQVDDTTFGWERDNTGEARYRSGSHSDIRYATMNHFRNGAWSIDVPNGRFQITLVTGDPSHTGQRSHLLVNETRLEDARPGENFMTHEFTLTVTDEQIVIKPDDDARNAKIVYLIIDPA